MQQVLEEQLVLLEEDVKYANQSVKMWYEKTQQCKLHKEFEELMYSTAKEMNITIKMQPYQSLRRNICDENSEYLDRHTNSLQCAEDYLLECENLAFVCKKALENLKK